MSKKRFTFVKSKKKRQNRAEHTIMADMKDRIRQIMEAQHMSQQTFANFIGINAASLSSIFNDRTRPTLNTVEALKSKIPNLNVDWLIFGRGTMFIGDGNGGDQQPGCDVADGGQSSLQGEAQMPDLFSGGGDAGVGHQPTAGYGSPVRTEVKFVERPRRQITEIRVFFDDQTYESFVPRK